MEIKKAERQKVPALIALAGPSGSGKTYSALIMAAGLRDKGKVGFIDTEKGRGSLYADNKGILQVLPDGYDILQLDEPFSPLRYIEALEKFEKKGGYDVVIIDSGSHEWEGFGGCSDIAENNKMKGNPNWAKAKIEHKKFMNRLLALPFHTIICLRARDKVEQVMRDGKLTINPIGVQPICEKNFKFEMLVACMIDTTTHRPIANHDFMKIPDGLQGIFDPNRYISPEDGQRIRLFFAGAKDLDTDLETLRRDCRAAANEGTASLLEFWKGLTKDQQAKVANYKDECKAIAAEVDRQLTDDEDGEDGQYNTQVKTPKPAETEPANDPAPQKEEKKPAAKKAAAAPKPAAQPEPEPKPEPAKPEPEPDSGEEYLGGDEPLDRADLPAAPADAPTEVANALADDEEGAEVAEEEDDGLPL